MKTILLPLALSGLLLACTATETAPAEGTPTTAAVASASRSVNYIVLLDLSDRLLVPGQILNDTALISHVFNRFRDIVVKKRFVVGSKDRFQVVIAPQQGVSFAPAHFMDALSVDLSKFKAGDKTDALEAVEDRFRQELSTLYAEATRNRTKPADFAGCDLWRYFNEHLGAALVPGADNRLVILTDGYLDFNDPKHALCQGHLCTTTNGLMPALRKRVDWASLIEHGEWGLLPIEKKFPDLSVAVVEINSKSEFLLEADLLKELWQKWLAEMGIANSQHIQRFNLNQSRTKLDSFLK